MKGRLKVTDPKVTITQLLSDLDSSQFLRPVGVSSDAWQVFVNSTVPELHDRLIYSTAVSNEVDAIITNHPDIIATTYPTIW